MTAPAGSGSGGGVAHRVAPARSRGACSTGARGRGMRQPPQAKSGLLARPASSSSEAGAPVDPARRTSVQPPVSWGSRPSLPCHVHLPRSRPTDQLRRHCWIRVWPPEWTHPCRWAGDRGHRRSGVIPSPARARGSKFGRMAPRPQLGDGGMWRVWLWRGCSRSRPTGAASAHHAA